MTEQAARSGDQLQRFLFEHLDIRGVVTQLQDSWQPVRDAGAYPPAVQQLLGELLTATALLASIVKIQGTLTVQATGDGAVGAIMAECRNRTDLRGIARLRDAEAAQAAIVNDGAMSTALLGQAVLTITIRPEGGEPYQGIVPLDGSTVASAIEGYFAQSEQIPTRLWINASAERTGGLLLQALPPELSRTGHGDSTRAEDFNRVSMLADTVTPRELIELPREQLLARLFYEEQVTLQASQPLAFVCSCSVERTREALRAMPAEELHDIIEQEGCIEMTCQFCHTQYRFDEIDVALVHQQPEPESGPTH